MKYTLATCAALAAIGCGQGETTTSTTGGPPWSACVWEKDGFEFPVCPAQDTSAFMGTIDGVPYSTTDSGHIAGTSPPTAPPYQLSMALAGTGSLDIDWGDPYIRGQWTKISGGGVMKLPGEGNTQRAVIVTSELLKSCTDYAFLYILDVTGGHLTGCSR